MREINTLKKELKSLRFADRKDNQRAIISVFLSIYWLTEAVTKLNWTFGGFNAKILHYSQNNPVPLWNELLSMLYSHKVLYTPVLLSMKIGMVATVVLLLFQRTRAFGLIASITLSILTMFTAGYESGAVVKMHIMAIGVGVTLLYYENRQRNVRKRVGTWWGRWKP